jgi:RNA polymerase sigma-70 factor (sigma-E family)
MRPHQSKRRATDPAVARTSDVDYVEAGVLGTPSEASGRLDVAALFRQHHADLVRLALLLVGDRGCAEDVVQDVYARLCVRGRDVGPDTALAYVRTAVVNGCRSVLRRRVIADRFAFSRAAQTEVQESAEHTAILAEDRRRVLAALAALPARRREVLVLRFYVGLPVAEVAAILGISQGSVKSAAARGLAALGQQLGRNDD